MLHEIFMARALQLAKRALGYTYPNPLVGCVIVHQGKIIGEGWHHQAGQPHAEINAIRSVARQELLRESTLYVTLEPCAHYGKTPPCAEKIATLQIPHVVIGSRDYHEKVNGKGIKILKNAGIKVSTGILEQKCLALNKRFFTFHQKKRPYLILKWAQSADGFLDKDFKPTQISNPRAQQIVHQLRAEEQAILVGTQTALVDNPSLTTRKVYGENPIRILIDKNLRVPTTSKLLNAEAPTFIFNLLQEKKVQNLNFIKLNGEKPFIPQLLHQLYLNDIQSVIVEGGAFTLQQFIDLNLWDEAWVFTAEKCFLQRGTLAPKLKAASFSQEQIGDNDLKIYKNPSGGI